MTQLTTEIFSLMISLFPALAPSCLGQCMKLQSSQADNQGHEDEELQSYNGWVESIRHELWRGGWLA